MHDDEMAMRILARLEAIERRLGIEPDSMSGARRDDRDRRGGRRWSGNDDDQDRGRRGGDERSRGSDFDGGCRFNEKRTVDQVVQLVTIRLEEMLRVLPQLIQVETRPARKEPPAAPPPAQ